MAKTMLKNEALLPENIKEWLGSIEAFDGQFVGCYLADNAIDQENDVVILDTDGEYLIKVMSRCRWDGINGEAWSMSIIDSDETSIYYVILLARQISSGNTYIFELPH